MKKINFFGPINSLGYGVASYNIWKNLSNISDICLFTIGNNISLPVQSSDEIINKIRQDLNKAANYNVHAPCIKIWHEHDLAERIGKGPLYSYPFFEVNKFNDRRKNHLKSSDHIIVASKWAQQILSKELGSNSNTYVVPCGVDRNIFNDENDIVNTVKCIFLNCGKWELRKGHDILHKAFKQAFQNNESVELWMMTENPFLSETETKHWQHLYQDNRIKLISRVSTQQELASIMNRSFCGVFPSRAEGWNLEAIEMMSCGKDIIITNYSAHTEFCNNENSHLIDIIEEEPIYDGKWFVGDNGTWACLDNHPYDQLISHFKTIYNKWKDNPYYINQRGIDTSKKLSWENAANNILNIMERD